MQDDRGERRSSSESPLPASATTLHRHADEVAPLRTQKGRIDAIVEHGPPPLRGGLLIVPRAIEFLTATGELNRDCQMPDQMVLLGKKRSRLKGRQLGVLYGLFLVVASGRRHLMPTAVAVIAVPNPTPSLTPPTRKL